MKIAIASDEARSVVVHVTAHLRAQGHDVRELPVGSWANIAADVAHAVARGEVDRGVVCCWTGTGVSIAANKVRGVRAALCGDAQTAEGARKWNDANVLALSLRLLSEPIAIEIVDAFMNGAYAGSEGESLARIEREEG